MANHGQSSGDDAIVALVGAGLVVLAVLSLGGVLLLYWCGKVIYRAWRKDKTNTTFWYSASICLGLVFVSIVLASLFGQGYLILATPGWIQFLIVCAILGREEYALLPPEAEDEPVVRTPQAAWWAEYTAWTRRRPNP
jgi:hypothetical protein